MNQFISPFHYFTISLYTAIILRKDLQVSA